jgi:hypothetical protein
MDLYIDAAMAADLVVHEAVAAVVEVAGVGEGLAGRALAGGERPQGHEGLEGGARRVGAVDGPVEERLVRRLLSWSQSWGAMPSTNRLGSKVGVDTSASTPPVPGSIATSAPRRLPKAFSTISCSLRSRVRTTLLPGSPGCAAAAHGTAAGIDLDLLEAGDAVQVALVALLEAGLADVVGAAVVGGVVALLDALEVAVVDAADVADHVGAEAAHRVVAEQARLQLDAGKR